MRLIYLRYRQFLSRFKKFENFENFHFPNMYQMAKSNEKFSIVKYKIQIRTPVDFH